MLAIFSKYLFIWYSLTIFFLTIIFNFQNEAILNKELLNFLFLPILIPFFEKIFEYIKKDSIFNFSLNTENFVKIFIIFFITSFLFFFKNINFYDSLVLAMIFFWIFFAIDERYFFLISSNLLVLIILNLILKEQKLAETFSIYLYYFLCIWVLVSILDSTINKYLNEKKEKNFLEKYKNEKLSKKIVYSSFLIYIFFIIFSIISKNIFLIEYFTIIFLFIYFIGKIFWFEINFKIWKEKFKWINFLNFYIITWILSTILLKINLVNNNFNIYFMIILFLVNVFFLYFIE